MNGFFINNSKDCLAWESARPLHANRGVELPPPHDLFSELVLPAKERGRSRLQANRDHSYAAAAWCGAREALLRPLSKQFDGLPSSALEHSIDNLPRDPKSVAARQAMVQSAVNDRKLLDRLASFAEDSARLAHTPERLMALYQPHNIQNAVWRRLKASIQETLWAVERIPGGSSAALDGLVAEVRGLADSRTWELLRRPCYSVADRLFTEEELPTRFGKVGFRGQKSMITALLRGPAPALAAAALAFGCGAAVVPAGTVASFVVGRMLSEIWEREIDNPKNFRRYFRPLMETLAGDERFARGLNAAAALGEIALLARLYRDQTGPKCFPAPLSSSAYFFRAENLWKLPDGRPGIDADPKTYEVRARVAAHVLYQLGGWVPAEEAQLSLVDHLFFCSENTDLFRLERRLGLNGHAVDAELLITPASLVVLHGLRPGRLSETDFARMTAILDRLRRLGCGASIVAPNFWA